MERQPHPPPTLEELLLPLLDSTYGLALHLTRDRANADDLVQEAVLNAIRGFGTFRTGSNFKAWFFRVVYNCYFSRFHARARRRELVGLEDAAEYFLVRRAIESGYSLQGADPVAATIGQLQSEQVSTALQSLPEEFRVVATMYFIEDLSYQEIADVLDLPLGTVRSRLHRGRKMLQRRLWTLAEDHGIVPRSGALGAREATV